MRQFGIMTENFEFQLEGNETVYEIPLAASMPASTLLKMQDAETNGTGLRVQIDVLRRYMGDIVDELSVQTITDIVTAWAQESQNTGASVGESSASSELSETTQEHLSTT